MNPRIHQFIERSQDIQKWFEGATPETAGGICCATDNMRPALIDQLAAECGLVCTEIRDVPGWAIGIWLEDI